MGLRSDARAAWERRHERVLDDLADSGILSEAMATVERDVMSYGGKWDHATPWEVVEDPFWFDYWFIILLDRDDDGDAPDPCRP